MDYIYKLEIAEIDEEESDEMFYTTEEKAVAAFKKALPVNIAVSKKKTYPSELILSALGVVEDIEMYYGVTKISIH